MVTREQAEGDYWRGGWVGWTSLPAYLLAHVDDWEEGSDEHRA